MEETSRDPGGAAAEGAPQSEPTPAGAQTRLVTSANADPAHTSIHILRLVLLAPVIKRASNVNGTALL